MIFVLLVAHLLLTIEWILFIICRLCLIAFLVLYIVLNLKNLAVFLRMFFGKRVVKNQTHFFTLQIELKGKSKCLYKLKSSI